MWYEFIVDLIKITGDGEVPEGWLGDYGISFVRLSAAQFACDEKHKGYETLEDALDVYKKWYSLGKDRLLSAGGLSLYGNVKFKRTDKKRIKTVRYISVMKSIHITEYGKPICMTFFARIPVGIGSILYGTRIVSRGSSIRRMKSKFE